MNQWKDSVLFTDPKDRWRIAGLLLSGLGVTLGLFALPSNPGQVAAWYLVLVGALLTTEALFIGKPPEPPFPAAVVTAASNDAPLKPDQIRQNEEEQIRYSKEKERYEKELRRFARGQLRRNVVQIALLVVWAVYLVVAGTNGWPPLRPVPRVDADALQRIDGDLQRIEGELKAWLGAPGRKDGGDGTTAQLPRELTDALIAALKAHSDAGGGFPWGTSITIILIVAVLAVVLGLSMKHPSAAPALGAAGVAAAAISNADHLSRLSPPMFWAVLVFFLLATLVLLVVCGKHLLGNGTGGGNIEERPLVIAFSCLLLLWVVVVVAFHAQAPAPGPGPGPNTNQKEEKESTKYTILPSPTFDQGFPKVLNPGDGADLGMDERKVQAMLTGLSAANVNPGDRLLLLGSADCTGYSRNSRDSNQALAMRRAVAIQNRLQGVHNLDQQNISPEPLPVYGSCKESEEHRTVIPILIQLKAAGH